MKKILSFAIVLMLLLSSVSAYGALPEFMTKSYNNYTAAYSVSVSFENSDELIDALTADYDSEFLQVIDLKSILKDVFSQNLTADIKADISSDFKKIKFSMTSESFSDVNISNNLNVKVNSKAGVWLNADFTAPEPIVELTAIHPYSSKYLYFDIMEICSSEEREALLDFVDYFFNEEFINGMKQPVLDLIEKHAHIKLSGNTCTVKLDNEGLIAILDQLCHNVWEFSNKLVISNSTEEVVYDGPDFTNVRLLGEKGITFTFTLSGKNPVKIETFADISLNLFESMPLEDGSLPPDVKFTFKETATVSKIGATKVTFPVLNTENSVDMTEQFKHEDTNDIEYYVPSIPEYWVWAYTPANVANDNPFYVPLRDTLESAYGDKVNITYNDGTITATSDHFPGFKTLTLEVGSNTIYTDNNAHPIGTVITKDGVTYVSCTLFENCFGWYLNRAQKDLLTGDCSFQFTTK